MSRNVTLDLAERARRTPDGPALLLPREGGLSLAALDSLVDRYAAALRAGGVREGQVVALTFGDEVALAAAFLALLRLGATVFSIPRSSTAHQRAEMARRAGAAWLATDRAGLYGCGLPEVVVTAQGLPSAAADTLCEAPSALAFLIMGSGSTGRPKLIPLTHANLHGRIQVQAGAAGVRPEDRVCALSHLDFFGSKLRLLECIHYGAAFVLPAGTRAELVEHCRTRPVSVLHATVYHVELLLKSLPPETTGALGGLRALVLTSSTVPDPLRQRIRQQLTENLYVRYGTNESGQLTSAGPPEVFELAGTVGRVEPGVRVEIVNAQGEPVPPGTMGLIRVRSPGQAIAYVGDDETTTRFFRDGWALPGDAGRFDASGQLVFLGRADDMMILNGINIYPAEIELVMTSHPAVVDAAAMPVKHPVHQDVPVCAVSLRAGAAVTDAELRAFALERLGARAPARVVLLPRIPRNEQGKLLRPELAQQLSELLGKPPGTTKEQAA